MLTVKQCPVGRAYGYDNSMVKALPSRFIVTK